MASTDSFYTLICSIQNSPDRLESNLDNISSEIDFLLTDVNLPGPLCKIFPRLQKLIDITRKHGFSNQKRNKLLQILQQIEKQLKPKPEPGPSPLIQENNSNIGNDSEVMEFIELMAKSQLSQLEELEMYALNYEKSNKDMDQKSIARLLHTMKGDFGVLNLREFTQLIHQTEERFLAGELKTESLLRLKDFLVKSNHFFLERKIPIVKQQDTDHIFINYSQLDQNVQESTSQKDKTETSKSRVDIDELIRIPKSKLDQLIHSINESLISYSILKSDYNIQAISDVEFEKKIAHSNLMMKQLQNFSMSLRLQPVQDIYQKMNRIIRDLQQELEKKVVFKTEGNDTLLDKSIIEKISDPIMHMIRNAMDHGIEPPAHRKSISKPEAGLIQIHSYNRAGKIFIQIKDDGKGLNAEKILQKARDLQIIEETKTPTTEEIYQFIFHPGFSTSDEVSSISGRGVGMDVVKRHIEELNGDIQVSSEPNEGTEFTMILPMTLATLEGIQIQVNHEQFIFPTSSIVDSIQLTPEEIMINGNETQNIKYKDSVIPICFVSQLLDLSPRDQAIHPESILLIVENMLGKKMGLIVDYILAKQQVVIKSLGDWLGHIPCISGGAILQDGSVCLIADIAGLIAMYHEKFKNNK